MQYRLPFLSSFTILSIAMSMTTACSGPAGQKQDGAAVSSDTAHAVDGSFAYDLHFLSQHDSVVVLHSDDPDAQIIVSPKYQAKVFTSTAKGMGGASFGWVNYKAFGAAPDPHMNAYGGENRLWLGPEGGKFSLYFKPGDSMAFHHWRTPAAFDTEAWAVTAQNEKSITLQKDMDLINYHGTALKLSVTRAIEILHTNEILTATGLAQDKDVKMVAYKTTNTLTNTGAEAWSESTGMPCIWILDMMKNSPATVIVVPYKNATHAGFDQVATTDYFGKIGDDRLKHDSQTIYLKADGKSRGKIGVKPAFTEPVIGSYDPQLHVLTVSLFKPDATARYLNQEWNVTKPPFSGDAVNAYNDGPLADGSQMGPFYEIESVSPAAFLAPKQALVHEHAVYHFTGPEASLDAISRKLLGVGLQQIGGAFGAAAK